jgi:hypothetical protein
MKSGTARLGLTSRRAPSNVCGIVVCETMQGCKYADLFKLVPQAIVRQTAVREPEDFIGRFTERIQALAANQDQLVKNEWQGVDVEDLVCAQLAHFADLLGSRIAVGGSTRSRKRVVRPARWW